MMLISVTRWYCEFFGSKAVSGTTAYSEVLNSFCNVDNSSVNACFYTDEIELQALVELVGIQGARFIDEQLLKMLIGSFSTIAEISAQNSSVIPTITFKSTPLQLKESMKKITGIVEFLDHAKTVGLIVQFRDLLYKAIKNVLSF